MLLMVITFCMSAKLTITGADIAMRGHDTSVAAMLLGAGRKAISAYFFEIAEVYFHAGMERRRATAFEDSIYQKWLSAISPRIHVHRHGKEIDEIMPWMWLAVRADPSNVEHYLTVAFCLAHELKRPDLAHSVLAEARWGNPFNSKIALEDAVLYLREGQIETSMALFNAALAFWPLTEHSDEADANMEKARTLLFRALLFEAKGDNASAIADLEAILKMFPNRKSLQTRITELASGNAPSLLASTYWNDILHQELVEKKGHKCSYGGEHCDEHNHHSHHR